MTGHPNSTLTVNTVPIVLVTSVTILAPLFVATFPRGKQFTRTLDQFLPNEPNGR